MGKPDAKPNAETEVKLAPLVVRPTVAQACPTVAQACAPRLLGRCKLQGTAPIVGIGALGSELSIGLALENGGFGLWNVESDALLFSRRRLFRNSGAVGCAAFAPHLEMLAMGHESGRVRWLAFDGRQVPGPAPHVGRALALSWTPTHFYSGGSDGVIWATPLEAASRKRRPSQALLEGLGAMTTLAVSPDGTLLCVGRDDGAIQAWRLAQGAAPRLDWTRTPGAAPIRSLHFSPGGAMLVSRSADGSLALWAAQTSYQLPLAPQAAQSPVAPAFGAQSRHLALANSSGGVDIFDVAMETLVESVPPLGETVRHLALAPGADAGSQRLFVAGEREIAVWEVSA